MDTTLDSSNVYLRTNATLTALFGMRAPTAPTLVKPNDLDTSHSKSVMFDWVKKDSMDSVYILETANDTIFTLNDDLDTITVDSLYKAFITNSKKFWHIKGMNPSGVSAWSTEWRVIVNQVGTSTFGFAFAGVAILSLGLGLGIGKMFYGFKK
jgi:hypothetical protein